jgi:hypothetical protein
MEDNIKMYLREREWEILDWNHLVQDGLLWTRQWTVGSFFSNRATISFWSRIQLQRVHYLFGPTQHPLYMELQMNFRRFWMRRLVADTFRRWEIWILFRSIWFEIFSERDPRNNVFWLCNPIFAVWSVCKNEVGWQFPIREPQGHKDTENKRNASETLGLLLLISDLSP